jgi:L-amino acid N-acyltransferase YncA
MIMIRHAQIADAAAVTAIYNQGIADRSATFETTPRTVAEMAGRLADQDRHPVLVATGKDGRVLGWAGLGAYRSRECYAGIAEFSIYLDREARGQGVGRELLAALVEAATERGFWKIVSRVFPSNAASRALCKACGFREVGTYEKHAQLDGQWLDVVIVERCLPASATPETNPVTKESP